MSQLDILIIAVGLSMDAFAVSLGASATNRARGARAKFRLAFHFGLFQFLMPICGWLLGVSVARYIEAVDHWIAFGLLAFVGGRMIRAGLVGGGEGDEPAGPDPTRGMTLVVLSVATSIDALAVGLTLAMLGTGIWYASMVIGVVTGCLSLVAIGLGARLGRAFGKRMELVGGCLLVAIGLRILVEHF
jgi:manganese efflux pump family protein